MARRKRILFYPDYPGSGYLAYKICLRNGYSITSSLSDSSDLIVLWRDATHIDVVVVDRIRRLGLKIVNERCIDISKTRLEEIHRKVFGYSLGVDPTQWQGPIVVKPDDNCAGPVRVLNGPLASIDPKLVYQRLIGDVATDGSLIEHRVSIVNGNIVLVRVRGRMKIAGDLRGPCTFSENLDWAEVFSLDEKERILRVADEAGLDFGEVDVMRDPTDNGKIYVIDVNRTPTGLRTRDGGLSAVDRYDALDRMSTAFDQYLSG